MGINWTRIQSLNLFMKKLSKIPSSEIYYTPLRELVGLPNVSTPGQLDWYDGLVIYLLRKRWDRSVYGEPP